MTSLSLFTFMHWRRKWQPTPMFWRIMGSCCAWPLLHVGCFSQVKSESRHHRCQPTRLPRPWDSPCKNTGVACHFLLQCMKVKSESEVAQLCPTLVTPQTAAYQAPPSMGFSRQEYSSGVPLASLLEQLSDQIKSDQLLSHIQLFSTP